MDTNQTNKLPDAALEETVNAGAPEETTAVEKTVKKRTSKKTTTDVTAAETVETPKKKKAPAAKTKKVKETAESEEPKDQASEAPVAETVATPAAEETLAETQPTESVKEDSPADNLSVTLTPSIVIESLETAADILQYLKSLIDTENPDKEKIDLIKVNFYKRQKQEIELAQKVFTEAGNDLEKFAIEPYNALETEFKSTLNLWREKRAEQIALLEKQKQENLDRKNQLIDKINQFTDNTDDIRKNLNEFRRLQAEWKEIGPVAQEQVNETWRKYQLAVEKFYDQLRLYNDFKDYDSKKNFELKNKLCESAEKLLTENDVVVAFRKLQDLHEQWRETGPVAKEIRENIWQRFKNASTEINKKYQSFFERLKQIENENLAQKTAICEAIEAIEIDKLDGFKAWDKKTNEVIEMQERWKTIGFAPKKLNTKVYERYRSACDRFFKAKSEFYKSTKDTLNVNMEKKKALCEKVEALKESTDWNATSNVLIQLQKEWKTIGPVPRKYSELLWKRFIAACDYFFEQKGKNTSSQKNIELKNLADKKALIEEVKALIEQKTESGEEAVRIVRDLNTRWNGIGFVPFKEKDKIYKQWREAIDRLTEHFNIDKTSRRLNFFQNNLDEIKTKGQGKLTYERERLMRQYESINSEIKTCENNIGFFTMSSKSTGSSLLKEMNKNIDKLKEERDIIYKKIQIIDQEQA